MQPSTTEEAAAAPKRNKWVKRGKVQRVMMIIKDMAPLEVLRVQENISTWKKEIIRQLGGEPKSGV